MPFPIKKLIEPDSICVIGASTHPEKIGHQVLKNILDGGFKGRLYPVNLEKKDILGLETKQSVLQIDSPVDLAIIVIPAIKVPAVVLECAAKKIRAVMIISAGFAEVGGHGKSLQKEVVEICRNNGMALLGPNCLGVINSSLKLNASFARGRPDSGNIAFLSQSGAMISSLIDLSKSAGFGFSKIFSLGNKGLLDEADLLEYLYEDPETKVIMLYLESLVIDRHLTGTLQRYAKKKPTILLFGGRSRYGAKAASSHTGSIVSSYRAIQTFLWQSGVILADSLDELIMFSRAFAICRKIRGGRIALITNAGGPAIAAADALAEQGLKMASLDQNTVSKLKEFLRPETNVHNPVDLLGDATDSDYYFALRTVAADEGVDGIVILLTPQTSTRIKETAEMIASYQSDKPILSSFVGGAQLLAAKEILEKNNKLCFSFPEEAVFFLRALLDFSAEPQTIAMPKVNDRRIFDPAQAGQYWKEFNLPAVDYKQAESFVELEKAAAGIGYPVVIKSDEATAHKSDEGKVILNIQNPSQLKEASAKTGLPAIVGKMITAKFELMLGIKKEESLGTTVIFGTGGIYAETYDDFSYRMAPVSIPMAEEMIQETKIGRILNGARNQTKHDISELARIVVQAVKLADGFSNLTEADFNPIIVDFEGRYHLADVRIITESE